MKVWFVLLNNFAHDLFTGLWFGCFLTLYMLRQRAAASVGSELGQRLQEIAQDFGGLAFLFLGLVVVTGLNRLFYYKDGDRLVLESGPLKRKILMVKHAVLGSAFLVGGALTYLWMA